MKDVMIEVGLAKSVLQVLGATMTGEVLVRRRPRGWLLRTMAGQPLAAVVLGACSSSQHRAGTRWLRAMRGSLSLRSTCAPSSDAKRTTPLTPRLSSLRRSAPRCASLNRGPGTSRPGRPCSGRRPEARPRRRRLRGWRREATWRHGDVPLRATSRPGGISRAAVLGGRRGPARPGVEGGAGQHRQAADHRRHGPRELGGSTPAWAGLLARSNAGPQAANAGGGRARQQVGAADLGYADTRGKLAGSGAGRGGLRCGRRRTDSAGEEGREVDEPDGRMIEPIRIGRASDGS